MRPKLVLSLSVETSKPRLVIDARAFNECCHHVPFTWNTAARVADVAEDGTYIGNLDGGSGFHNVSLQLEGWPVLGVPYAGTDYV